MNENNNNNKFKSIITILAIALTILCIGIYAYNNLGVKDNTQKTDFFQILENILNSTNEELNYSDTNTPDNTNQLELIEAKVTKVIDGDTLWVKIDGKSYKVRFIGINCPEYTKEIEPYGKESTEYTTKKLLNKTVYLQADISDTDSYDRLLRYVWTEKIDEITEENIQNYLFNYELVYNGYAQSNYYKPNITLQEYLEDAENYAKNNKIGMWKYNIKQ